MSIVDSPLMFFAVLAVVILIVSWIAAEAILYWLNGGLCLRDWGKKAWNRFKMR